MKFLLVILGWTAVLLNLNQARENKVVYTTSDGTYTDWYMVSPNKDFEFQIRAKAFKIIFATFPVDELPKIEIGINHSNASNIGVIWRDNVDVKNVAIDPKYNANEDKFIRYWIKWRFNNIMKIGLQGEQTEFLSWEDDNPFPIKYVGVSTVDSDKPGIWIIDYAIYN